MRYKLPRMADHEPNQPPQEEDSKRLLFYLPSIMFTGMTALIATIGFVESKTGLPPSVSERMYSLAEDTGIGTIASLIYGGVADFINRPKN